MKTGGGGGGCGKETTHYHSELHSRSFLFCCCSHINTETTRKDINLSHRTRAGGVGGGWWEPCGSAAEIGINTTKALINKTEEKNKDTNLQ